MIKVPRSEWGARPPKAVPLGINTQSGTAHWEGTSMGSFDHSSCATKVRVIQNYHMDTQGWNDIAYNFIVCPHGWIFVGRDHGIRSSANGTNASNAVSEAVCFLGGVGDPFPLEAQAAMKEIMAEISAERHCHRDWYNTQCPGDEICNEVRNNFQNVQPVPTQIPTIPKDDLMFVFQAAGQSGAMLMCGGKVWPIINGEDIGHLLAACHQATVTPIGAATFEAWTHV